MALKASLIKTTMDDPARRAKRFQTGSVPAVFAVYALAGVLLYAGILQAPFVFDDLVMLGDPGLCLTELTPAGLRGLGDITIENTGPRVFSNLTFALNHYVCRRDVVGYHLFNLLVHVITAGLVFLVCRVTLSRDDHRPRLVPFLAGLLWLVHPLHIQSVTYIWQRMNSLAALFSLLALYCWVSARKSTPRDKRNGQLGRPALLAAGAVAFLLALASKQTVALLPLTIFIYEWFFLQDLRPAWLKKRLPWLCLATLICIGLIWCNLGGHPVDRLLLTYADKPFTPVQRLLTEPRVVIFYVSLLFFPHPDRLTIDYDFPLSPAATPVSVLALLSLAALAVVAARKHRLLSFAVIWFLLHLVIESSLVGLDLIYGYRTYLPSTFLFMALTALLFQAVKTRTAATLVLAAGIGLSGFWTFQHNRVWRDDTALWQDAIAKAPLKARPYHNLGLARQSRGDFKNAAVAYQRALDIRLKTAGPDHYKTGQTWNDLGVVYDRLGDTDRAADCYQKALDVFQRRFGPDHPQTTGVQNNLCVLYGRQGDFGRAAGWCQKALAARLSTLGPDHPDVADAHNNLGLALAGAGAFSQARVQLETALGIYQRSLGDRHPKTDQCRRNLMGLMTPARTADRPPASSAGQERSK